MFNLFQYHRKLCGHLLFYFLDFWICSMTTSITFQYFGWGEFPILQREEGQVPTISIFRDKEKMKSKGRIPVESDPFNRVIQNDPWGHQQLSKSLHINALFIMFSKLYAWCCQQLNGIMGVHIFTTRQKQHDYGLALIFFFHKQIFTVSQKNTNTRHHPVLFVWNIYCTLSHIDILF